jgi:hypothetical protein
MVRLTPEVWLPLASYANVVLMVPPEMLVTPCGRAEPATG